MRHFWSSVSVIAARDFRAILFSRSFLFFLIGPLFPVTIALMAGGIGASVSGKLSEPMLGIAMTSDDADAFVTARNRLADTLRGVPETSVLIRIEKGEGVDARSLLNRAKDGSPIAAILTGSLDNPTLTGPEGRVEAWRGQVALIAGEARRAGRLDAPEVTLDKVVTSRADEVRRRIRTAQAAQTLLFLLTMLLAGMVLSNMVEEKANKIIEVLAAAVPMDAVFAGKLVAMLGVSIVGVAVWGTVVGAAVLAGAGTGIPIFAAPAVGWPLFLVFGFIYFAFAYLLLGSLFLTIGGLAATVREVQTLSMPATMLQLIVFFFASYALGALGEPIEKVAIAVPFSSPFIMLARSAVEPEIMPHVLAIAWQFMWVAIFIKLGSSLFRRTVMKSGPAQTGVLAAIKRAAAAMTFTAGSSRS